jgi:adenylate kinase family enzyme
MIALGKEHPNYLPSSILSKKIKKFHDNAVRLLPYLRSSCNLFEVDTEQTFVNSFKELCSFVEPTVLHVRSGGSSNELRKEIVERLQQGYEFVNLDVNSLIRDENERKTSIGLEFLNMVAAGKIIPAEMIVRMLRRIIYSGDGRKKFILSSFPDIIE